MGGERRLWELEWHVSGVSGGIDWLVLCQRRAEFVCGCLVPSFCLSHLVPLHTGFLNPTATPFCLLNPVSFIMPCKKETAQASPLGSILCCDVRALWPLPMYRRHQLLTFQGLACSAHSTAK